MTCPEMTYPNPASTGNCRSLANYQRLLWSLLATVLLGVAVLRAETPNTGAKAPDFTLSTPEGAAVSLSSLEAKGPVVLIVLRGYPGYQCPYCERQAHDFQVNAAKFAEKGAQVLLVYPGPPADLGAHANEFLAKAGKLPANFHLVIDPDYKFTNQYDLRWNAEAETAYPSTFLIDRSGKIFFRKISHDHGDRTTAAAVLAELAKAR